MKLCPLVHHPFLVCHSERSEESAIVVKSFLENDDRKLQNVQECDATEVEENINAGL